MEVTTQAELAHWRYRVKALEVELPKWEQWTRETGSDARRWPEEPHISLHEETKETLAFTRYLLEEARYYVELVEIEIST